MSPSARKAVGMAGLLLGLLAYIVLVVTLWDAIAGVHWALDLLYFVMAGIAWAFPARYLLGWMHRPSS